MMQVHLHAHTDEVERLLHDWERLAANRPLVSPAWLFTWWKRLGQSAHRRKAQLAVLTVTEGDRIVAVAPWFIETTLLHGRRIRFLGAGEVCSDYLSIPCDTGYERPAMEAIAEWLCDENIADGLMWDSICMECIDESDAAIAALRDALAQRGAVTHSTPSARCWRLTLPDSWDAYLATLSKSHRKRVRRLERTYLDCGRARLRRVETPDELDRGFDILLQLHALRWSSQGKPGAFDDESICAFHREAVRELFESNSLHLAWLELDGRAIAAEYSLVGDGVIYAYQSGMDPSAVQHEPGSLALIATLRLAYEAGFRAIDFMRGDEPYKQHWRATPRVMHDLRIVPGAWPNRLRHSIWQASASAKNWLRVGRDAVLTTARCF